MVQSDMDIYEPPTVTEISYDDLLSALAIAWESLQRIAGGGVADCPKEAADVIQAVRAALGVASAHNVEAVDVFVMSHDPDVEQN